MNEELVNLNKSSVKTIIIAAIIIIGLYVFFEYKYNKLAQENSLKIAEIKLLNKLQKAEQKAQVQPVDVDSITQAFENKIAEVSKKIDEKTNQEISENFAEKKNKIILKKLVRQMNLLEEKIAENSKQVSVEIKEKIKILEEQNEFENKTINILLKTFKSQLSVEKLDDNNLTKSEKIKNLTTFNEQLDQTLASKNYNKMLEIAENIKVFADFAVANNMLKNINNFLIIRQKMLDEQKNSLIAQ